MKLKLNMSMKKYYDDSNKVVIGKMKDKTAGIAIKEFVGVKAKMYLILVDNKEQKKTDVIRNAPTVSHIEYEHL